MANKQVPDPLAEVARTSERPHLIALGKLTANSAGEELLEHVEELAEERKVQEIPNPTRAQMEEALLGLVAAVQAGEITQFAIISTTAAGITRLTRGPARLPDPAKLIGCMEVAKLGLIGDELELEEA